MIRGIDALSGATLELDIDRGSATSTIDSELPCFSRGWFDIQVNGWGRIDFNGDDLSVELAEELCLRLARRGTVRFLATVITAHQDQILARLAAIRKCCEQSSIVSRHVAGIHVEGPYISSEDGARGAHLRAATRDPDMGELDGWIEASGNMIRLITLAPERAGAMDFVAAAVSRGIVAAIGHTDANAEQIRVAVEAGATFSTHLGNGIGERLHRHDNPIWPQLSEDRLTTGLIADGHHLPNHALKSMIRAKGADRIVTVSDAAAPGGLGPGSYQWSGITVEVNEDGRLGMAGTPYLAGAGHLQDRGLKTLVDQTGISVAEATATLTKNPHELLGDPPDTWTLEPRAPADLVVFRFDPDRRETTIESVHVDGELL